MRVALVALKQYKEGATRLEKNCSRKWCTRRWRCGPRCWARRRRPGCWRATPAAPTPPTPVRSAYAPTIPTCWWIVPRLPAPPAGYDKAVADLTVVLKANPTRLDALVFRASANRALDRLDPALTDINKALSAAPPRVRRGPAGARLYQRVPRRRDCGYQGLAARHGRWPPNTGDAATCESEPQAPRRRQHRPPIRARPQKRRRNRVREGLLP